MFQIAGMLLAVAMSSFAADKAVWKAFDNATLRIDDTPPKIWNIYHSGKNVDPLLLMLGSRSLAIYIHDQSIYEIPPAQLEHKGADLRWRESDRPEKPLPSSTWTTRDVGFAYRIRFTLTGEGRMFDIQIPQMPGLRGLD
jgi:hypothetical protein